MYTHADFYTSSLVFQSFNLVCNKSCCDSFILYRLINMYQPKKQQVPDPRSELAFLNIYNYLILPLSRCCKDNTEYEKRNLAYAFRPMIHYQNPLLHGERTECEQASAQSLLHPPCWPAGSAFTLYWKSTTWESYWVVLFYVCFKNNWTPHQFKKKKHIKMQVYNSDTSSGFQI